MSAVSTCSLYSGDHPSVQQLSGKVYLIALDFLNTLGKVVIMDVGEELVINEVAIKQPGIHEKNLVKKMKRKGISRIELLDGLTQGEMTAFIIDMGSLCEGMNTYRNIKIGIVSVSYGQAGEERDTLPGGEEVPFLPADELTGEIMGEVKNAFSSVSPFKKLNTAGLEEQVMNFIGTFRKEVHILKLISPVRSYSEYTYTHATNVSILTMVQAEALGIKGNLLRDIGIAALLHDVGKLFVPNEILEKKGKLDDKEFDEIKKHTLYGAKYLTRSYDITPLAPIVAYEHHLRFNGGGYPQDRIFQDTPRVCSQLVLVSDFFDALRSRRPYKKDWAIKDILILMRKESGSTFNSSLVDNFSHIVGKNLGEQ